ncbi:MAG: dihydrofolate reductase family protein, partial [Candidatus Kerfeldbacteria bacterium]|nr:dihydrofolate reductase family protein [Candidatus Kerfeldbacteria bacterium]
QTLLKENLIDRMIIMTHPVTIGSGKKLFAEGTQPAEWKLVDSTVTSKGVIFATYEPNGELRTGAVGT